MEIYYSPKFARQYKDLPMSVKLRAEKAEKLFRANPFHARLKTHKLSGKLSGCWSFSVDYSHRVIFEFYKKNVVRFHAVGDHTTYKRS